MNTLKQWRRGQQQWRGRASSWRGFLERLPLRFGTRAAPSQGHSTVETARRYRLKVATSGQSVFNMEAWYLWECGGHRRRSFDFCLCRLSLLGGCLTIADGWDNLFFWCQENLSGEMIKIISNVDKSTSFSVETRSSTKSTFGTVWLSFWSTSLISCFCFCCELLLRWWGGCVAVAGTNSTSTFSLLSSFFRLLDLKIRVG